jgi:hypothetical protein
VNAYDRHPMHLLGMKLVDPANPRGRPLDIPLVAISTVRQRPLRRRSFAKFGTSEHAASVIGRPGSRCR